MNDSTTVLCKNISHSFWFCDVSMVDGGCGIRLLKNRSEMGHILWICIRTISMSPRHCSSGKIRNDRDELHTGKFTIAIAFGANCRANLFWSNQTVRITHSNLLIRISNKSFHSLNKLRIIIHTNEWVWCQRIWIVTLTNSHQFTAVSPFNFEYIQIYTHF